MKKLLDAYVLISGAAIHIMDAQSNAEINYVKNGSDLVRFCKTNGINIVNKENFVPNIREQLPKE